MKYFRLFVTFAIIAALTGCSTINSSKKTVDLQTITQDRNYRIRVRTGNIALDRIVYTTTFNVFGRHLPVSEEAPYSGFIEVVFSSASGKIIGKITPSYKTNVQYGNSWYTGGDPVNAGSLIKNEFEPGELLTLITSTMDISIKNIKGGKLWDAHYTVKGGKNDPLTFVRRVDAAAKLSIERIADKFIKDFEVTPEPEEVKTKKKLPPFALIVKSRWQKTGKNSHGHIVYADTHTISYPTEETITVWTKSRWRSNSYLDLVRIHCTENKFIFIEGRQDKNPSLLPFPDKWSTISPESTPELILKALCRK